MCSDNGAGYDSGGSLGLVEVGFANEKYIIIYKQECFQNGFNFEH